jgi:dCTP deaminase
MELPKPPCSLRDYMSRPSLSDRLVVTPLLNTKAVGAASIDVRLGNQFIIMKREALPHIDTFEMDKIHAQLGKYQQRIVKSYDENIVVHPRQLLIGSTLEYVKMPPDLMCYVIGKSSWGRLGLIIATATKVDPGFRGCITLEIVNDGEVPLVLRPNSEIAQLVFHPVTTEPNSVYAGKYRCPVGPEFPKF